MYFTFKRDVSTMELVEKFSFDDRNMDIVINGMYLEINKANYENAKTALAYIIAEHGNYVHEDVLDNPNVATPWFDVVATSIEEFLKPAGTN